ncbi:MAG: hypothetical protein OXP66_06315, partial [Candidatus Tectomicrobia bacterium]|nr:hypothetical protein [Candidatus Tectomicrobia bacterium]
MDQQAGKAAILQAFQAVEQTAGPRDVFLFYFSGHVLTLNCGMPLEESRKDSRNRKQPAYTRWRKLPCS